MDDEDFKMKVTRTEMEEMCEDMFNRATKPIDEALKASEITLVGWQLVFSMFCLCLHLYLVVSA